MQIFEAVVTAVSMPFLQVSYAYQSGLRDHIARPVFCGLSSGVQWMPSPGDHVALVLIQGGYPIALCGLGHYTDADLATLTPLLAGETAILGPTGNLLRTVRSGTVQAGNPANAFKAVVLDGDAVRVSGSVPSGGGSVTLTGTVTASSVVLEGN